MLQGLARGSSSSVAPAFSEGSSAGGWCKKATPQRRVIGLNERAYSEYLGKIIGARLDASNWRKCLAKGWCSRGPQ